MYTEFSQVYDRLMADVPYQDWAAYYACLLKEFHMPHEGRCIDCSCGTGNLTIPLAKLGFRMTGIDNSPDMLNIAQQKSRMCGVRIPFVHMDMRSLRVQRPVDAVISTCDGVNYLLTPEDVSAFFSAAYRSIKPGGILLFDISTPYKLTERIGDRFFSSSHDEFVYIWQGDYHRQRKILDIHMDIFILDTNGMYRRIQEDQQQRAHRQDEIMSWLTEAGFRDQHIFGDRTMDEPHPKELRWHILARKGE